MTKRARSGQHTGVLKAAVVMGSVAATFWGTQLLAAQDAAQVVDTPPEPIVLNVPIALPTSQSAPATAVSNIPADIPAVNLNQVPSPAVGGVSLNLLPIPQAVTPHISQPSPRPAAPPVSAPAPRPVTQTKSSK